MEIKEYILSGCLELYVLGQLTEDENNFIQKLYSKHPEIKNEIDEMEDSIHAYVLADARPLDLSKRKKAILGKLNFSSPL